jgi:hypothetical protein
MTRRILLSACLVVSTFAVTGCKKGPTTEPEQVHHGDGYHGSEGHHGGEHRPDFEGRERVEQAGGPASDPDPADGGAIDDSRDDLL